MWPKAFWEKIYEPAIRNSAGLGTLSTESDPDTYDKGFCYCDILIIGAGASGLSAALTAASSGAKVILADEDFLMGDENLIDEAEDTMTILSKYSSTEELSGVLNFGR
jgi:sarcosine oxidase subunit alpha